MKTTTKDSWLKLSDVAARLGVSAKMVQRWCDAGMLTHRKYPTGHYAVSLSEAERLERESLRERVKILVPRLPGVASQRVEESDDLTSSRPDVLNQ